MSNIIKMALATLATLLLLSSCQNTSKQPIMKPSQSSIINESSLPDIDTASDLEESISESEIEVPSDNLFGDIEIFKEGDTYGYKKGDKIVVEAKYDIANSFDPTTNLALVGYKVDSTIEQTNNNSVNGYINVEGKEIIPPVYTSLGGFYNDVTYAQKGGMWGIIDISGEDVVPFIYEFAENNRNNEYKKNPKDMLLIVGIDGKNGMINFDGDTLVPIEYDYVEFPNLSKEGILDDIIFFVTYPFYRKLYVGENINVIGGDDFYKDFQYEILDVNGNSVYKSPSIYRNHSSNNVKIMNENHDGFYVYPTDNIKPEKIDINGVNSGFQDYYGFPTSWGIYENQPIYEVFLLNKNSVREEVLF